MSIEHDIGIRCHHCNKVVPYYNKRLYKIITKRGKCKQLHSPDNGYRYYSQQCVEEKIAQRKEDVNYSIACTYNIKRRKVL